MNSSWPESFRARMRDFGHHLPPPADAVPVSIKIRVVSGCFHRSCSPCGYELIDDSLRQASSVEPYFTFEEHESGPEVLVYVAAGVGLVTSIVNLVATIIKARSEGTKRGDRPSAPVELIVRRVVDDNSIRDEVVLRCDHADQVNADVIEARLNDALDRLLGPKTEKPASSAAPSRTKPKRKRT